MLPKNPLLDDDVMQRLKQIEIECARRRGEYRGSQVASESARWPWALVVTIVAAALGAVAAVISALVSG